MRFRSLKAKLCAFALAGALASLCLFSCSQAWGYQPLLSDPAGGRWYRVQGGGDGVYSFDIEYELGKGYKVFDFELLLGAWGETAPIKVAGETYENASDGLFSLDTSHPVTGKPIHIEGRFIAFANCVGSLEYDGITKTWTASP